MQIGIIVDGTIYPSADSGHLCFLDRVGVGLYPGCCVKMNMDKFTAFIRVVIVKLECRLVLLWMVQSIRVLIRVISAFWTRSGSDLGV